MSRILLYRPLRVRVRVLVLSVTLGSALQPLAQGLQAQAVAKALAKAATQSPDTQSPQPKPPGDHRFRFLGIGAAIGAALAFGYYQMSDKGTRSGQCMPISCALPYLTISGGISGLFLAKELAAQQRAEMPRAGDALVFPFIEVALPAAANAIAARDSLVLVATDSGAQVISGGARPVALRRRGAGLSDVRSVAFIGPDAHVLIGTGTALWETPLTTGLLSRVMDGAVDALSTNGAVVVAAFGKTVRVRHLVNGEARIDSIGMDAPVTTATFDPTSGSWWITTDSQLFELTVPSSGSTAPVLTARAPFSGQARSVATSPNWLAIAIGSDGLLLFPRSSLRNSGVVSPIVIRGEPRFAFDVAFVGDQLFVASGVDGVTRVDLSSTPRIAGSSRQAGYATSIRAADGVLWVGDRSRERIMRIVP